MARYVLLLLIIISTTLYSQDDLSGLYWVSASGAINQTSQSPQRQIVRGNGYLYITQNGENLTIDWGGFLGIMGDIQFKGHIGNQMIATDARATTATYQLTATISPGNKLMGRFVEVRTADANAGWTTLRFRADKIDLTCESINVGNLDISTVDNRKILKSGAISLGEFKERKSASTAAKALKDLGINKICFAIPPKPSLYFLTQNDGLPTRSSNDVTCKPLQLSSLAIVNESGQWVIVQGKTSILFCKTKLEAQVILALMMYYKASEICETSSLEPIYFLK